MYQLEIKAALVSHRFPPGDGWQVTVDVDAMERANGGQHPEGKRQRAEIAEARLRLLGAKIVPHPVYGRADLVAFHPTQGLFVVEVEGASSRQREQAMYSALGQVVLSMRSLEPGVTYALAVPDEHLWLRHVRKIPAIAAARLRLTVFAVGASGVREVSDFARFDA